MNERKQGRRSAQTAEATKFQILKVAMEMFCNLGYERVSLRNISENAGVSHSLIRHHFGSKEQIWYAISDKLHEYMAEYVMSLINSIDVELPVNERLYQFSSRLLAHMLIVEKPLQFTADVVRQENKFFDYMVDQHGKLEHLFEAMTDDFNKEHPDHKVSMWEQKWLLITHAHSAISLKPFMKEIWPDSEAHEERLLKHWKLFDQHIAKLYFVDDDKRLVPEKLRELLLPIAECWEINNAKLDLTRM